MRASIPADLSRGMTFRDRTLRYLAAELGALAELLPRPPRGGTSRGKVRPWDFFERETPRWLESSDYSSVRK